MNIRLKNSTIVAALGVLVVLPSAVGQRSDAPAANAGPWTFPVEAASTQQTQTSWIEPAVFETALLDRDAMALTLSNAPAESTVAVADSTAILQVPMPDGRIERFRIAEAPVMAPALAAKYPEIKTYVGQGIDDPAATARFDITPTGFHAQILSPRGAVYVDPRFRGNDTVHATYYKRDFRAAGARPACTIVPNPLAPAPPNNGVASVSAVLPSGGDLRTYRLAVAATGEYTQFHGGTVAAGMAAIVTAINRVTGIYEIEVAVRMVLVANNDQLVFTNSSTDPYSNNNGGAMLSQNRTTINNIIGLSNYDVGHVFSTGGGGVASLSVICTSGKAFGVTGLFAPIGDPFYVDFVAHEMGHQFGGLHTFNGVRSSCGGGNRSGSAAYEPGSGSTIQAYAGICGADNLQPNSDPYFHSISYDQIRNHVTFGNGGICPVITSTGNTPPVVDAGLDVTIPRSTPFVLTATGSDVDPDVLTYGWEERDLGPAATLEAPDDGSIPLFRSFNPTTDSSRTFPRLSNIISGVSTDDEKLPATNRTMRFRVTVRDNRAGGGGVDSDERLVTVDAGSGPFRITAPIDAISVSGPAQIMWAVAGTANPPVNAPLVNILMSTDGGNTFPVTLAASTPNDGSETVSIPNLNGDSASIKVEGVDNVFFAVSGFCTPPAPPTEGNSPVAKNRYLTLDTGSPGSMLAISVTLVDLPGSFSALNGTTMWVSSPIDVSENSGAVAPEAGFSNFKAATLTCNPVFADWGAMGTVHVYHSVIIPGARYDVQVADMSCGLTGANGLSVPLTVTMSQFGDAVGLFDSNTGEWTPPNFSADITGDVVAGLDKFSNLPGSPIKARVDLSPDEPDQVVGITDISLMIDAFRGLGYPFVFVQAPCN